MSKAKKKAGALQGVARLSFRSTGTLAGSGALRGTAAVGSGKRDHKAVSRAHGAKGGRHSDKPMRAQLLRAYDKHMAASGSRHEARASLVKELIKNKGCSATTARAWLRDAGIKRQ